MKRLIVTTIFAPNDEKKIYTNLDETFKLSALEVQFLDQGKELSVMESEGPEGKVFTKVRIESVGAGYA